MGKILEKKFVGPKKWKLNLNYFPVDENCVAVERKL